MAQATSLVLYQILSYYTVDNTHQQVYNSNIDTRRIYMQAYTRQYYIEDYMCDRLGRLLPSYLLRIAQSISILHCKDMNVFYKLDALGHRFLLSKQHCEISQPIMSGQYVTVSTYPTTPVISTYPRITTFANDKGENIATIDARWFLFDTNSGRPLRHLDDSIHYSYVDTGRLPPITMPNVATNAIQTLTVQYTDIDSNRHVNNAVYLDYLSNILCDKYISQFAIAYHKQLTADTVQLSSVYIDDNTYYLEGHSDNIKNFDIVATLQQ